jgi:hypothetical protein
MILRYSRIPPLLFATISLAIGGPLLLALLGHSPRLTSGTEPIAWIFVVVSAVVLARSLQLLIAPPVVLNLAAEGIHIHYRAGSHNLSKEADLLPWQLIRSMRLIRVYGRAHAFNWAVELELSALPAFDVSKRDALHGSLSRPPGVHLFSLDTFLLDRPRKEVLATLEEKWRQWQRLNARSTNAAGGEIK